METCVHFMAMNRIGVFEYLCPFIPLHKIFTYMYMEYIFSELVGGPICMHGLTDRGTLVVECGVVRE